MYSSRSDLSDTKYNLTDRREHTRSVLHGCKSPITGEIMHNLLIITTFLCLKKKKSSLPFTSVKGKTQEVQASLFQYYFKNILRNFIYAPQIGDLLSKLQIKAN